MKDGIINGNGDSRWLKSGIPVGTTWAQALEMLRAGNFPIDLNGINQSGWQQVGTALNKINLLPDETAEKIGLTSNATIADMMAVLADVGNLHVWERGRIVPPTYTLGAAEKIAISSWGGASSKTTLEYSPTITVDDDGRIVLENPATVDVSYNTYTAANILKGKFYRGINSTDVYFCEANAEISAEHPSQYVVYGSLICPVFTTPRVYADVEYLVSTKDDAYPLYADVGDYHFTCLGRNGNGLRVLTGYYIGTGMFGVSTPTSVTLPLRPKLFAVFSSTNAANVIIHFSPETEIVATTSAGEPYRIGVHIAGLSVSWWAESHVSATTQLNQLGVKYTWFAFY